jgi:phosphoglucomutase
MKVSPYAGKPAEPAMLVKVPKLITAYYTEVPDPKVSLQRVAFGTSGHRGSAFDKAFNEWHILAISQAICLYRKQQKIDDPLFEKALRAATTHRHDYLNSYIADLASVLDMDAIRGAKISMGVDPLGVAGK